MPKNNKQMGDDELSVIVSSLIQDSVSYNSTWMKQNEEYLKRYNREAYGDEEAGYSQVIASDVRDTVEADMTSMVRVFLGSGDVIAFEPITDDEAEIEEAKQKTQLINHMILRRAGAYKIIHDFLKDSEIQKMGVVHYFMDTIKDTSERLIKDQTLEDITQLMEDEKAKDNVSNVVIAAKEDKDDGFFDIRIRVTTERKDFVIQNITTEDFLLSRNASSLDEAQAVGHVSYPTRSELVAQGMSEEEVAKFPSGSTSSSSNAGSQNPQNNSGGQAENMKAIRWRDEGGDIIDQEAFGEWSAEIVRVETLYAKVDFDGDGIAERRLIVKTGGTITHNEAYDHVPYAVTSAIIEPHKAIGEGRASLVVQDQSVNTELERAVLDNIYDVGNPRTILGADVNTDDYFDDRRSGVVRMKKNAKTAPKEAAFPLTVPYIGAEVMQVQQSRDQQKADRTGSMLASQGLEADQLNQETATRFNGVEKANEAKIELVARNHAETGFRKLYEGAAWTLQRFQDEEQKVRIGGKAVSITPSEWQFPTVAVSQVGLGAGAGDKTVQQLTGLFAIQSQLKQEGSILVDEQDRYNSLDKMVQALGFARTSDFFNNPEVPQELLMASYEKLVMAMQQAQEQIAGLSEQASLSQAARIEAEGKLQLGREKNALDAAKFDADRTDKQMSMIQDGKQFEADKTFDYTKLELEHGVDIQGEGQGG